MATCLLEKEFPTTFLNVMMHLPVHLVQQLFTCGPVHCWWMYPIERYMKTLKDYIRTYAHLEGSIAEGYRMDDTLGFCTEYMKDIAEQHIVCGIRQRTPLWMMRFYGHTNRGRVLCQTSFEITRMLLFWTMRHVLKIGANECSNQWFDARLAVVAFHCWYVNWITPYQMSWMNRILIWIHTVCTVTRTW